MHLNRLRLFALADDAIHEHVEGRLTERIFRLMDGGQRRGKETRVTHVIIPDQRNILRHAQPHLVGGAKRAHRHDVAAAEDCGRARMLRENLLHSAIARLRLEVTLDYPVCRNIDLRFFHGFHKAGEATCTGVTFQRTWNDANIAMPAFNQVTTSHIAAFESIIDDRVGKVGFGFAPVHHYHWNMAILFQHWEQGFGIFGTHHQQAINAFLRHHWQISTLFLEVVPCVAKNQGIAFLEAVFLNGFDNLSKVGRFAAGCQQTNWFGVVDFQATGNGARWIVQFFDRCPHRFPRLFGDKTRFVNYMWYGCSGNVCALRYIFNCCHSISLQTLACPW